MSDKVPRIDTTVCIGNDPILVAELSSLSCKNDCYFAVLDAPRMGRPDVDAEVIRRNNVLAYIQPPKIIFAHLKKEEQQALQGKLPEKRIIKINNSSEILTKLPRPKRLRPEDLRWGKERLAIGLLKAKYEKKRLRVDLQVSPDETYQRGRSAHLVVVEDGNELSSVIAANYAFSINAGLAIIPKIPDTEAESLIESFYTIYSGEGEPISEKIGALRSKIRGLASNLNLKGVQCITFMTAKLPWGFAFPEIPTTHFFLYPDLGLTLALGIIAEQSNYPGIRAGVLIEPGEYSGSETEIITRSLGARKSVVYVLTQEMAKVYAVDQMIQFFPYDFLFIATHAADVPGDRLTYKFTDSEGKDRTLVLDRALGFGKKPGEDLIHVQELMSFVSHDGIPWENKKELNVGKSMHDFMSLKKDNKFQPTQSEPIPRVRNSMALKMHDNIYLPFFHNIADVNMPIIFNNACCSWRDLAERFIFAGARVYIGTVFDVNVLETKEIAKSFFERHINRSLVFALWRAQNDVYTDFNRRPYIMFGPHFSKIRIPKINAKDYILRSLPLIIEKWSDNAKNNDKEDVRKNSKEAADFLGKILEDIKGQNL